MSDPRRCMPTAVTLVVGLALGWGLANQRPHVARAGGSDRYGDDSLTAGPVAIQYNERYKTQATQDALYYLDWRGGRLMATVPLERQSVKGSKLIEGFVERDLRADFKIDTERGVNPHFLMTTGSLGAYGEGWSPLYVFETTTKQVAVYKLQLQAIGVKSKFELLEIKSFAELPALPPNP
jgi:hypothetical protein